MTVSSLFLVQVDFEKGMDVSDAKILLFKKDFRKASHFIIIKGKRNKIE